MLKNLARTKILQHSIFLFSCLTYSSKAICEEESDANAVQDVQKIPNNQEEAENTAAREVQNKNLSWYFAGTLGNSSFNGETSLVSSNLAGLELGVNFYQQSVRAYFEAMAQSYNSGISDYASNHSSLSYSNKFWPSVRVEGGISRLEANSSINSATAVFYGGLTYYNTEAWIYGIIYYSSKYMLSVAKDIESTQINPFIQWHIDPGFLNSELKLGFNVNSSRVNTTYNNEVYFTSEGLNYLSYIYELALQTSSYTLKFNYWQGEEYATVGNHGRFIRSLFNHYTRGSSIEISYHASSNSKIILSIGNEQFFERERNHLALETMARLGTSFSL